MHNPTPLRRFGRCTAIALAGVLSLAGSGCSIGTIVARTTVSVLDGGVDAMNRETDLELAKSAIPANLKLMEGLIFEDPGNLVLREYTAQAIYGYAFGFVEDESRQRASALYERCLAHGLQGLRVAGLKVDAARASEDELDAALARLGRRAVPSLFWSASCWAKLIDMNRDDPGRLADIGRAAALMGRVLELDETFYYGGPHLFFGVFYGSRPPMLGGDYAKAAQHFAKAEEISGGNLFLVDVLRAQFLDRQQLDQKSFHDRLTRVIDGSAADFPEQALVNRISQEKARGLLAHEAEWF